MSASLNLTGIQEMRQALLALPDDMARAEFAPIVRASADGLVSELKATYPKHDGVLANSVVVDGGNDPRGLRLRVRSKAQHAHLYELGTVRRFTAGTGANRGTMPARPIFVPTAIRWRVRMMGQVRGALQRMRIPGFTGSAEVRES